MLQIAGKHYQASVVVAVDWLEVLDFEAEVELTALVPLTRHVYVAVEGLHNALADAQAQADALLILHVVVVQFPKHFEYFYLVTFSDSDTRVTHRY